MKETRLRHPDIWANQSGKCHYCGRDMRPPGLAYLNGVPRDLGTLDHVLPKSKGGSNRKRNLVYSCRACNAAKGDRVLGGSESPRFPEPGDVVQRDGQLFQLTEHGNLVWTGNSHEPDPRDLAHAL